MVQRTSDRPITTFGRPQWQLESGNSRIPLSSIPPTPHQSALEGKSVLPVPMWTPGQYGDLQLRPITYLVTGDQLVLSRPIRAQRVLLIIQNSLATGNIVVNFDNPASGINGIFLAPQGSLIFDNIVPQNDVHIYCFALTTLVIAYMEIDITDSEHILRELGR